MLPSQGVLYLVVAFNLALIVERISCISFEKIQHDELNWNGYCGNSDYDSPRNLPRSSYFKRASISSLFRKKQVNKTRQNSDSIAFGERLKNELVTVRLNVVYDPLLAYEFPILEDLKTYVRNLIYATQLVYEQPEMSERVKLNFVVVRLQALDRNFAADQDVNRILVAFGRTPFVVGSDIADLNILLTFRNYWDINQEQPQRKRKVLGLAYVGTFCNLEMPSNERALVLNAFSLGTSITFAHELAHSFNCHHDGYTQSPKGLASKCDANSFIMSPSVGPKKLKWSPCTVDCIVDFFSDERISNCIYDKTRINSAKPVEPRFDFTPNHKNPNRRPYPGESYSIDRQCARFLDQTASSSLTRLNDNGLYSTCEDLSCVLNDFMRIYIGPAPTGSTCSINSQKKGRCKYGSCMVVE